MLKTMRSLLATLGLATALLLPAFVLATQAHAQTEVNPELCRGINYTLGETGDNCADGDADESVQNIITTIINLFSVVVGAISVIMIIIGGLRYITSAGDAGAVSGAKNTILYAIVGLVIVIFAQTIVRFVVDRIVG